MATGRVLAAWWTLYGVAAMSRVLGSTAPSAGVTFHIYQTADSPVSEDLEELLPSHPVILLMHGFKGDSTAKSMLAIRQALLLTSVQNVVLVDWSPLADAPNRSAIAAYQHVRDHGVPTAASLVAVWLEKVLLQKAISPDQVHLVGFSLGAHLAGVVGRLLNSTLGRITALDPPKFGYEATPVHKRLTASSAKFVNVIHTSSGVLSYPEPIGHVDFFPNGDALPQPGCPTESPIHVVTCSHYMSFVLFSESVLNTHALMATECDSWLSYKVGKCDRRPKVAMGLSTPNTTRGVFFMSTNEEPPFSGVKWNIPVPADMRALLIYEEADAIISPLDVEGLIPSRDILDGPDNSDADAGVMRVHTRRTYGSKTSTTESPPAFIDSGSLKAELSFGIAYLLVLVFPLCRSQ